MLTDKQERTFLKLKAGELKAREKADFYFRLSKILRRNLEDIQDLTRLLVELPDSYLKKVDLSQAALSTMKLNEKLIEKMDLTPIVYPGGKAVKNFLVMQPSYIPGIAELKVFHELSYTPSKDDRDFFYKFNSHIKVLQEAASTNKPPHKYKEHTPEEAASAIKRELLRHKVEEYSTKIEPAAGTSEDLIVLNALIQAQKAGHPVPEEIIKTLMIKLRLNKSEK